MIHNIKSYDELDSRKLMAIYAESNLENTDDFFPDIEDKALAIQKVEEGFLDFLKNEFFSASGNEYFVLEENSEWVCALRLNLIEPGIYYLEALETRPDMRQKGYAKKLLTGVIDELKKRGAFELYDTVYKKNDPSVRTHLAAGFGIVSEKGFTYLGLSERDCNYGMGYVYPAKQDQ